MLSRRWLGALALAAGFAVAAVLLGRWQWGRHEDAVARVAAIDANYDAAPVPLESVLTAAGVPASREWARVRVGGQYVAGSLLLVRNRPRDGVYGYDVVVPLRLSTGGTLLVDRGWVPNGATAAKRPRVPPTPLGSVTVTGWLRSPEPSLRRDLPAGQLGSISVRDAAAQTGEALYDGYLVVQSEAASGPVASPLTPDPPDRDLGPHLAYAIQWWAAAPVGFVLVLVGVRREHRERGEGTPELVPARPRKVRIWDEEDA